MSISQKQVGIDKIALALDASPLSIAVMDEAVIMAETFGAKLSIVCIKDETLSKLAKSSIARTVSPFSSCNQNLTMEFVDGMFQLQEQAARSALNYALSGHDIEAELIIKEGCVSNEIIEEGNSSDLLIMGWSGWQSANFYSSTHTFFGHKRLDFSSQSPAKLGSTVRRILDTSTKPVLIMRDRISDVSHISVIYDGSPEADKAIKMTAEKIRYITGLSLAAATGEINIILRPEDSKDEDAILKKCEDLLYPFNINAHYEVVERTKPLTKVLDILSKQAGDENKGLLVIGDGTKVFKEILKHPEAFGSLHYSLFVCK